MKTRALVAATAALVLIPSRAEACGIMMIDEGESVSPAVIDATEPYVFFTAPEIEKGRGAVVEVRLADALERLSQSFGFCYEDLLRRKPDALSEARFKIDVAKTGAVKAAKMTKTSLSAKDSGFDACLNAAALDWKVASDAVTGAFAFTASFRFAPPLQPSSLVAAKPAKATNGKSKPAH